MAMFCFQCQETAKGTGCEVRGVCGKTDIQAKLQDLLIYSIKGIALIMVNVSGKDQIKLQKYSFSLTDKPIFGLSDQSLSAALHHEVLKSLFMTITNANFDEIALSQQIKKMIFLRNELKKAINFTGSTQDALNFEVKSMEDMLDKASTVGVLATENEDVRSLRELIIYGIKGMAAYTHHSLNLGQESEKIYHFIYKGLASTLDHTLTVDQLVALTLETGEYGVAAMALLDQANTGRYGNPEITQVNIGVGKNPGILISGHDLTDLEQLLEQTKDRGIDIYTHSEMLPAHYYPYFKKYSHLVANYGNAWWAQNTEFESFRGPILFTTNCIVPPKNEEVKKRIFTSGASGLAGCTHIEADKEGKKDFSAIIEMARTCEVPAEIEQGYITGGFAHHQVISLADTVVEAVKSGQIKKFFVMAGCDGRMKSRDYYTEFAKQLPEDTIILTAGCAKYRYNKLDLGDIGGIPRVLDAGQCNDSYSLALIALKLKEVFGLEDINQLPIAFNIAWYEQKAVIVLLALLYLGVKNIHLGPTLPGFLSPNVVHVLVENFQIAGVGTVEDDIALFMQQS